MRPSTEPDCRPKDSNTKKNVLKKSVRLFNSTQIARLLKLQCDVMCCRSHSHYTNQDHANANVATIHRKEALAAAEGLLLPRDN